MYFGAGVGKLQHALKTLKVHWEATEDGWRDQLRQDFEERRLEPIAAQSVTTLRAMAQLADIFTRIQRDCS